MVSGRQSSERGRRRAVDPTPPGASLRSAFHRLRNRWFFMAPLAVVVLASGCTVVVGGKAQPAPDLAPRPLAGSTITRVLLGHTTLSRILKQPMIVDHRFPSRFGGPEALQADGTSSPVDCLGVAGMLEQSAYHSGNVKGVAVQAWRHAAVSAAVTEVREGVVSLPTAADANALFAAFSRQWQNCNGRTQPLSDNVFRLTATIDQVRVADSVLGATIWLALASSGKDTDSIPAGRAVGVQGNCLVEVEVDFFNASRSSLRGQGGIPTSAQDIAELMMDRIGALGELTPR